MRDYWLTQELLQAAGFGFLALAALGIGLALWLPKKWWGKLLAVVVVVGYLVSQPLRTGKEEVQQKQAEQTAYQARYNAAHALFQERCKTAGEKIYRTVEGVEGVVLLKVRPGYGYPAESEDNLISTERDPNWPDAGLPNQYNGEDYIKNFLLWEQLQDGQDKRLPRGYLNNKRSDLPGYQYVDVLSEDQTIYRYRLADPGNIDTSKLERSVLQGKPARYAVTYTNDLNESDRKHWVAGTTVLVVDTQTSETIAESTWYSFEPGFGSKAGFRLPWRLAYTCPELRGTQSYATRFFIDQILKPKP